MSRVSKNLTDGRYFGNEDVDSAGAWTDVAIASWDTLTSEAIPATAVLASLSVTETDGATPCYVLLRANAAEATGVAWEIAAGTTQAFALFNPDAPIRTISVYGKARLKAVFYPG